MNPGKIFLIGSQNSDCIAVKIPHPYGAGTLMSLGFLSTTTLGKSKSSIEIKNSSPLLSIDL